MRKIADELDGDRAKRHAARMARTRQWAAVTQTVSMLASSGASFVQQEFFKLAETEINYPPMQKPASVAPRGLVCRLSRVERRLILGVAAQTGRKPVFPPSLFG